MNTDCTEIASQGLAMTKVMENVFHDFKIFALFAKIRIISDYSCGKRFPLNKNMNNSANNYNSSEIGKEGENIAAKYLIDRGFKIIDRNYLQTFGEIDIIARAKDQTLVFVEVKTLLAPKKDVAMENVFHDGLRPEDNLTPAKLMKLKKICQFYAAKNPELIDEDRGWQIDLIAIELTDSLKCGDLRYYENIA